jgi:hypothetical protein
MPAFSAIYGVIYAEICGEICGENSYEENSYVEIYEPFIIN